MDDISLPHPARDWGYRKKIFVPIGAPIVHVDSISNEESNWMDGVTALVNASIDKTLIVSIELTRSVASADVAVVERWQMRHASVPLKKVRR